MGPASCISSDGGASNDLGDVKMLRLAAGCRESNQLMRRRSYLEIIVVAVFLLLLLCCWLENILQSRLNKMTTVSIELESISL